MMIPMFQRIRDGKLQGGVVGGASVMIAEADIVKLGTGTVRWSAGDMKEQ
jgi:hypothetical protein